MGLDQYAYSTTQRIVGQVDFDFNRVQSREITTWRKHPICMVGWKISTARKRGGRL